MNYTDVNRMFAALARADRDGGQITGPDLDSLERVGVSACQTNHSYAVALLRWLDKMANNPDRTPEANRGNVELRDRVRRAVVQ